MYPLLNLVFPKRCVSCRQHVREGVLCGACKPHAFADIEVKHQACPGPIGTNLSYTVITLSAYCAPGIRAMVRAAKFGMVREAATLIGRNMARNTAALKVRGSAIVIPIPLGKKRLRERGYNQAESMAEPVAKALSADIRTDILLRIRNTEPQTSFATAYERTKNIAGCFALQNREYIEGKTVVIVDDVITSGATIREAALTLMRSGADRIIAFVWARARVHER